MEKLDAAVNAAKTIKKYEKRIQIKNIFLIGNRSQ